MADEGAKEQDSRWQVKVRRNETLECTVGAGARSLIK